jgi:hypothetical protein
MCQTWVLKKRNIVQTSERERKENVNTSLIFPNVNSFILKANRSGQNSTTNR